MKELAVDVSTHNGVIDFEKVKQAGVNNVIIRCGVTGYGSSLSMWKDDYFERNYENAKRAGLNVGTYYYAVATSEEAAEREAAFVLSLLKGKQFELPVYYDVEDNHDTEGIGVHPLNMQTLGKEKLTAVVDRFCSIIEGAGYYTGIYTSTWWCEQLLNMDVLNRYTLWLAQWADAVTYRGNYDVWQYTNLGKVDGMLGYVDMNYIYTDFPTIIKRLGLNGFNAQDAEPEQTAATVTLQGATATGEAVSVKVTKEQAQEIATLAGLL